MSIRSHLVTEIKHKGESFNLSHDRKFMEYLEKHSEFMEKLDGDLCGIVDIMRHEIEDIEEDSKCNGDYLDIKECIDQVKKDIGKDEYAQYYCF